MTPGMLILLAEWVFGAPSPPPFLRRGSLTASRANRMTGHGTARRHAGEIKRRPSPSGPLPDRAVAVGSALRAQAKLGHRKEGVDTALVDSETIPLLSRSARRKDRLLPHTPPEYAQSKEGSELLRHHEIWPRNHGAYRPGLLWHDQVAVVVDLRNSHPPVMAGNLPALTHYMDACREIRTTRAARQV